MGTCTAGGRFVPAWPIWTGWGQVGRSGVRGGRRHGAACSLPLAKGQQASQERVELCHLWYPSRKAPHHTQGPHNRNHGAGGNWKGKVGRGCGRARDPGDCRARGSLGTLEECIHTCAQWRASIQMPAPLRASVAVSIDPQRGAQLWVGNSGG